MSLHHEGNTAERNSLFTTLERLTQTKDERTYIMEARNGRMARLLDFWRAKRELLIIRAEARLPVPHSERSIA